MNTVKREIFHIEAQEIRKRVLAVPGSVSERSGEILFRKNDHQILKFDEIYVHTELPRKVGTMTRWRVL